MNTTLSNPIYFIPKFFLSISDFWRRYKIGGDTMPVGFYIGGLIVLEVVDYIVTGSWF
ncbi:hypothetical protein [Priestia megaterium]|uniref:hypothetical protein n=1 Tax=Priestia megaterium TaxID=1404 RepID=UPI00159BA25F|nr:hypothetical protein [Priestia megaterium]